MPKLTILDWKEASATAIVNVATSVASSTATDHMDVAKAGISIQNLIINVYYLTGGPEDVDERSLKDLKQEATKLEEKAQTAGVPNTEIFKLKHDLENDLRNAETVGQKMFCWISYVGGLAKIISDWFKISGD